MSSTTSTNAVPGMVYPTQKGMLSGNPRDSAMQQMTNTNIKQASLSNAVGGKRKSKRGKYGGDGIAVPQYQMLYTPQGGPSTNPNTQIQQNSQTSTQAAANSVYDNEATKMGGYKKKLSRKGGNTDWKWGCLSGGTKRRQHRKLHKKNKSKRTKKNRKH